ncbi:hypothetical protein MRB53_001731 [Persea americana]|uniref:Uncharacterized protein n=1 Tax=Persea americana TaxID=3435 RepID=A0ACC2MT62_PERAE|nr:hypothetical protein MRB53_001731 [Persea americana]
MERVGEIGHTWFSGDILAKIFVDGSGDNLMRRWRKHPAVSKRGTISRNCKVNRAMEDLVVDIFILESNTPIYRSIGSFEVACR